jgi:flagellar hook protein FlgE
MRVGPSSSVALSGLQAASAALDVSAANVARATADGETAFDAQNSDLMNGGVKVTISEEARAGGPSLERAMVGQTIAATEYRANLASLRASDEHLRVLLSLGAPASSSE